MLPKDAVVAVAMSGGVDSSVAAARCVEQGVKTLGITLALWPRNREIVRDRGCCSIDAVEDARRVANKLGIRHFVWNLENDFNETVIRPFEDAYASGTTPNPCVRCNATVKFGVLLERALQVGATHVATGHYARVQKNGKGFTLHRAQAKAKDQSYTLHRLSQNQLAHALFPLGDVKEKREVREEAEAHEFITARKAESQELCFVDVSLRDELQRRLDGRFRSGPIVDLSGTVIGEHRGLPFYTVGQRSGLGLAPDVPDAEPLYVLKIDPALNRITVGPREALRQSKISAADCSWISGNPPEPGSTVAAQLRAHGAAHPARVTVAARDRIDLETDEGVEAVSPGQSLVAYNGDEVLGGGEVL